MQEIKIPKIVHVALSGASGMQYGLRLVEYLLSQKIGVSLYLTQVAKEVLSLELDVDANHKEELAKLLKIEKKNKSFLQIYYDQEWTAPIASGSGIKGPLVVCPCSMGMISAVSLGSSNNLIERACDVAIKEGKKLVLVPRETPFSSIHLENMLKLSKMGVCILPASPGFYHKPKNINQLVDFVVARVLDQIAVPQSLVKPWGG